MEMRIKLAARRLMINMETTIHNKEQDNIPDGIRGSRRERDGTTWNNLLLVVSFSQADSLRTLKRQER